MQRSQSSALIPLDTAAHSLKIDANIIRAENALQRGPQKHNVHTSQGEGFGSEEGRAARGFGSQRGQTAGSLLAALEGSEFALVSLQPGSVLTPLSGTKALTSQYWALCGEALRRGRGEEILHVSGDPRQ